MARILMLYLASLMIRSLCIAAIAGVCTVWIRSVTVRHAVWVCVMAAMLLMPVTDAVLPISWVPAPVERIANDKVQTYQIVIAESLSQPAISVPVTPGPSQKRTVNGWAMAAALYALVSMVLVARLGLAWRRISKLKRHSRPITVASCEEVAIAQGLRWRMPQLRESDSVRVPITIGFSAPVVILPSDWNIWDDWKLRAVLAHEFAHVRRRDWTIAAVASLNQCVFWLSPLSAFLRRQLSELSERASDDAALHLDNDAARYAEVLLQFATAHNGYRFHAGGIAMAKLNMRSRIERVLRIQRPSTGVLKLAGWALVLTLSTPVLYAAAAIQVASTIAPTPSYSQIVAQLPLPKAPNQADLQQLAHLQSPAQNAASPQAAAPQELYERLLSQSRPIEKQINSRYAPPTGQSNATPAVPVSRYAAVPQQLQQVILGNVELEKGLSAAQSPRVAQEQLDSSAKVSSGASSPKVVTRVEPVYLPALRSAGIEGSVVLKVSIGPDGITGEITTVKTTNPLFAAAAVEAVKQWVFEPGVLDGKPVSVIFELPVDFKLPAGGAVVSSGNRDALLDLPDNKDDLLAYLTQLAQLRGRPPQANRDSVNSSFRIYVMGKVQKPGVFVSDKPITVLQALALAGGFTEFAKTSDITIVRGSGTNSGTFPFNYSKVIDGTASSQNIQLESGDSIVVP